MIENNPVGSVIYAVFSQCKSYFTIEEKVNLFTMTPINTTVNNMNQGKFNQSTY